MSNMINKAIEVAMKAHQDKVRLADDVPYLTHPIEVGITLARNNQEDEIVAAGILHDAVEDEYISFEEVEEIFGPKVKRIVYNVYHADTDGKGSFIQQKQTTVDYIRDHSSASYKFVVCADKLSNVRIMLEKRKEIGDKVWDNYEESWEELAWYHQSMVVALSKLYRYDLYKEYTEIVEDLFGEIPPVRFINQDLVTIDEKVDVDMAEKTSWLAEPMITFLGAIIDHYNITANIKKHIDVKDVMESILEHRQAIIRDEEVELSDEEWLDILRVFYILRYFLRYHDKWIKENIGVDYLAWYKLYDNRFKHRIH